MTNVLQELVELYNAGKLDELLEAKEKPQLETAAA